MENIIENHCNGEFAFGNTTLEAFSFVPSIGIQSIVFDRVIRNFITGTIVLFVIHQFSII